MVVSVKTAFQTRGILSVPLSGFLPFVKTVEMSSALYSPFQWGAVTAWMSTFVLSGLYRRVNLPFPDEFLRVLKGVVTGWVVIVAGTFLYRGSEYSRLMLGLSGAFSFLTILTFRSLAHASYQGLAMKWWEPHEVLVLGNRRMAHSIKKILSSQPDVSVTEKVLQTPDELDLYLKDHKVREVFAGEPDLTHSVLIAMSEVCEDKEVSFRIVPDVLESRMGEVVLDTSLGLPTFQIRSLSLHGWTFFYKRLFDVAAATAILSLGFFPLVFLALLIKLDSPGTVFHRQGRVGHRGRLFPFLKFRSMISDAEEQLDSLLDKNERPGRVFKMRNDPRVTRVGRWIRKFSLDEFPQLLNVLRGEMSLVGPRPQLPREVEGVGDWERKRVNVLPGVTGLWQVSGRARLTYEQMIDLDIYYIERWSPGLDLTILVKTLPAVLGGHGAY